jgi:hypothetical protein
LHKGFKCLDPSTDRVYISRDVVFDENIYPFAAFHPNVGARLRSEILLLPEHLSPLFHGDNTATDLSNQSPDTCATNSTCATDSSVSLESTGFIPFLPGRNLPASPSNSAPATAVTGPATASASDPQHAVTSVLNPTPTPPTNPGAASGGGGSFSIDAATLRTPVGPASQVGVGMLEPTACRVPLAQPPTRSTPSSTTPSAPISTSPAPLASTVPDPPPRPSTRLQHGIRKPKVYQDGTVHWCNSIVTEPNNLRQALGDSNWKLAMDKEFGALQQNKT